MTGIIRNAFWAFFFVLAALVFTVPAKDHDLKEEFRHEVIDAGSVIKENDSQIFDQVLRELGQKGVNILIVSAEVQDEKFQKMLQSKLSSKKYQKLLLILSAKASPITFQEYSVKGKELSLLDTKVINSQAIADAVRDEISLFLKKEAHTVGMEFSGTGTGDGLQGKPLWKIAVVLSGFIGCIILLLIRSNQKKPWAFYQGLIFTGLFWLIGARHYWLGTFFCLGVGLYFAWLSRMAYREFRRRGLKKIFG